MFKANNIDDIRKNFEELHKKDHLTNGKLSTWDDHHSSVHLELLASASPFFRALMIDTPMDGAQEKMVVPLIGVRGSDIQAIIRYLYAGDLNVSPEGHAVSVIVLSENLGMPEIKEKCMELLVNNLNEQNCVEFLNFAKETSCTDLVRLCKKYLLKNFEQVFAKKNYFEAMTVDDLEATLQSDELNAPDEKAVFWAAVQWIDNDPENRIQYMPRLLYCFRFGFSTPEFYDSQVATHPYVSDNQDCAPILYQVSLLFSDMLSNGDVQMPLELHHPAVRPRIPNEIIFVIGGWFNGSASNIIETYDNRAKRWFPSPYTDDLPRAYHGLAVVNGIIYMIGGFDGNFCFSSVRAFDPIACEWKERANMYVARCYVSVTTIDGFVYAMGGYDGRVRMSSAERYDCRNNQWNMITSMHHTRSDANATTLNGKIFIAGGFSGTQVLSSAEMYDPSTDMWTLIPTMSSPRSGVNVCAYGDLVYVLGGFNGTNRLNSVECYDPVTRHWRDAPAMTIPRSNFATVVVEGKLYVIGGFNGMTTVPNVEYLNVSSHEWTPAPEMNLNRSALAACVVKGLPNNNEYSFLGRAAVISE